MDIASLLTLGGLAAAVAIVFEAIKRMAGFSPAFMDRFGPLMAIALGIALGGGAAFLQHADIVQAVINGVLAGLSATGLYNVSPDAIRFGTPTADPAPAPGS